MSDMILNSIYDKQLIEHEKQVILAEVEHVNGDPMEFVLENGHFTAFRDHVMGQPILGNLRSIPKLGAEDLFNFVQNNYVGCRIVVVGVGEVEHNELVEEAEKRLGGLPEHSDQIIGEE